jgi:hypothetical protein
MLYRMQYRSNRVVVFSSWLNDDSGRRDVALAVTSYQSRCFPFGSNRRTGGLNVHQIARAGSA